MKLKKILSMILIFVISFGVVGLSDICNGMEVSNEKINIDGKPRYRCMRCGYISDISLKNSRNSRRTMIYCKNCRNKESLGKNLKFKLFDPRTVKRTRRFGICPNSQPRKIHLGYIKDSRINRKTGNMSRPKLVDGTDNFEFHCYDCRKDMIIPPNPKKASGQ